MAVLNAEGVDLVAARVKRAANAIVRVILWIWEVDQDSLIEYYGEEVVVASSELYESVESGGGRNKYQTTPQLHQQLQQKVYISELTG